MDNIEQRRISSTRKFDSKEQDKENKRLSHNVKENTNKFTETLSEPKSHIEKFQNIISPLFKY